MKNLTEKLQQFTCPARYYRHWESKMIFTEGIKYLAEKAGAYWLINTIGLIAELHRRELIRHKVFRLDLQVHDNGSGSIIVTAEDNLTIKEVLIEEIDFPLANITLFLTLGCSPKTQAVLMLASEY